MGQLTLICGPPCSGKSTFLREHSSPGDVRFDWDDIYCALTGLGGHERSHDLRSLLNNFREEIVQHWGAELREVPEDTWIIGSAARASSRERFKKMGAEVVLLACDQAECHRRASDAGRPEEWHKAIDRWFSEFQPDISEEVRSMASEMKDAAVKVVDAERGILAGWGIPFGGPMDGRDLDGQFFEKDTDFALDWFPNEGRPLLFDHGMDAGVKASVVGRQTSHKLDEKLGVWIEAQLNMAHRYAEAVIELAGQGALGFSSGAMKHLVVVDDATGKIMRWPWVEESLTAVPANPYGLIAPDAVKHLQALALDVPEPLLNELKVWEETENEIRHSIRDPDKFQEDSFRRITIKKDKPRVFAIIGRLKGETSTKVQSLRFPKEDSWTMAKAKKWAADHPDIGKSSTFVDEAEALLADAEAFLARSESIASLRAEEGRDWPGQAGREQIVAVKSRLVTVQGRLDALLTATEPIDAAKLLAEFQRTVARQQGVAI